MTLDELAVQVTACSRCPRREGCNAPVPGIGMVGAKYFIIGRDPGATEDKSGVPFTGQAGKRLNKLLFVAKIDLNDCYITNMVKCHAEGNVAPKKAERLACYQWLRQELSLVRPQYVIPLGSEALSLFTQQGIKQLHGCSFEYELELDET